jgi:hypothetical protein
MRRFSKEQKFFVIMTIFVCGLLIYANVVAFNFISVPTFVFDIIAYVALAAALALMLTVVIMDRRKRLSAKTQVSNALGAVKDQNETSDVIPLPVNLQKTSKVVEVDVAEQKNHSVKQLVMEPTKLFCPACRKEFSLGIFEGDYMINFGPPKPSNLIRYCPHCEARIMLKRKGTEEENVWNDNV